MPDAVVVGAGPNGLVAANLLADAGWDVLVLEEQPEPGGAVRSGETAHPGFVHDRFSSFYPLVAASHGDARRSSSSASGCGCGARRAAVAQPAARRPRGGDLRRRPRPHVRAAWRRSRPATARRSPAGWATGTRDRARRWSTR